MAVLFSFSPHAHEEFEVQRGDVAQWDERTLLEFGRTGVLSSQATGLHIFRHSSTVLTEELWAFFPFAPLNSTFCLEGMFWFLVL